MYLGKVTIALERVGVQARIETYASKAIYVYCNSHWLNLVITQSSRIMKVQNSFNRLKDLCFSFWIARNERAFF